MSTGEEREKKIDETWKASVEKQKETDDAGAVSDAGYPPEMTFELFLSSLVIEGLIALGEIENPATQKKETQLAQARYIIDIIALLASKTKNNLTGEEQEAIDRGLYELRMRYVAKAPTTEKGPKVTM
ncbi:MAG: DUF1844 domain-containing protein [Candidatus Omnitrophota bacterium]